MKRWLPYPLFVIGLFAIWLLLNQSIAPGTVLLGVVLAVAGGWLLSLLKPPRARFRRLGLAVKLALVVLVEIIRSNNAVAWIILRKGAKDRKSGFVTIPLDTRNPYTLAALACIITATPGTIWVEYNSSDNTILLHVLDLIDGQGWSEIIKQRYERPLMEIFG
jgi:multicomponent K+:H+ antiporter subunit E